MLTAAFLFSAMGGLVKFLGNRLDSFEVAFFRALCALIFVMPFILRAGRGAFRTKRPRLHLARGTIGATAMMAGFYSYMHLPLAEVTAISFARGLFLVPLALFILHEPVGPRRLGATAVGFIGVLIVLQPSMSMDPAALVAVTSAFLIAVTSVLVKILSRTEQPITLMFYSTLIFTLMTAIPAGLVWVTPTWAELAIMLAIGGLAAGAQACAIRAFRVADATALAPLDYTRLLFAASIGFLFFGHVPGLWTWVGASVIIAATLYITYREAQAARAEKPVPQAETAQALRPATD